MITDFTCSDLQWHAVNPEPIKESPDNREHKKRFIDKSKFD
jgi:hypothetical protein